MAGAVAGWPRILLRLEGAFIGGGAAMLYPATGHSWGLFGLLFLLPDVSMSA